MWVVHTCSDGVQELFEVKIYNNRSITKSLKFFKVVLVANIFGC